MSTPAPLCTHIKANGITCGSPAISGTDLCYHHATIKTALGAVVPLGQVAYGVFTPIPFIFPEDRAALQINYFLLFQALNEQRIDPRSATLLHRMLRAMAANLGKSGSLTEQPNQPPQTGARTTTPAPPPAEAVTPAQASEPAADPSEIVIPTEASAAEEPAVPPSSHNPTPEERAARQPMGTFSAEGQRILALYHSRPLDR